MLVSRLARAAARTALLMALAGCDVLDTDPAATVRLESMTLRRGAAPPAPPIGAPLDVAALRALGGWEPVTLPDVWGLTRRARGIEGWYHGEVALPPESREWAILVDGSFRELDVYANGLRLGGMSRHQRRPLAAHLWTSALLLPLPQSAAHVDLMLHYRTTAADMGAITSVTAGPHARLAETTAQRSFLRATVPTALALIGFAGGLMVLVLARFSREPGIYWFGASTSIWCLSNLIAADPVSLVGWLASVGSHAFVPAVATGFHRVLGLRRPGIEAGLAGMVAIFAALRVAVPPLFVPGVDIIWWLGNFGVGLYILPLAIRSERLRATAGARWVLFAGLVLVAAGCHDALSAFAGRMLLAPFSLFAAASPVIAIATAGAIVASLAQTLQQVRALNVDLEDRVEEKRRELTASWARTAELERERAIASERERMMRDMHDGTGGQLVSALALVEGGEFRADDLADTLRAALSDLRLTIDSLEAGPPDLLALLAHARTRLETRLEHHGVRFSWEVEDVPTPAGFGPEQSLHVLRIFQEAVTNALKHARAKTIAVRTGTIRDDEDRRCTFIEIADDGCGFAETPARGPASGGRGLRNIRRRAAEIGGRCTVTSAPTGTSVRLLLPAL